MQSLAGKNALVTGASRGIGRAIALRLAAQGARVAVHYGRNRELAQEVAQLCAQQSFAIACDLARIDNLEAMVSELRQQFQDSVHILVHNAGVAEAVSFSHTSEEQFDKMLSVNLKAPFFLTQKLLPYLVDGARIIHISSQVARLAYPDELAYTLTKGALETLNLQLAALLGERNITVNAIAPGTIQTDMCAWLSDPQQRQATLWQQAIQRLGQPDDVAGAVQFLASPEASWITGQVLVVSGGCAL